MNFSKTLIYWYLKHKRDLPWRNTKNPYYVWLSEIMLQQTRVAQGLPYFLRFKAAFPTVFDLAKAEEQTVLKLWQGLGYYSRARNLHFTAKFIAEDLDGKFPTNYKEIIKLKGIGDYTASAIASICFDENTAVVDGNVYRVLSRFFGIKTPINSTLGIKEFKALAQTLIDETQPGTYNQAIMDFGATQCTPKNPDCTTCPFNESCVALQKNLIGVLPVKDKKVKVSHKYFNYLVVITKDKQTIFSERTTKGIWQGLYQFPLIESKQSIEERELVSSTKFQELFPEETTVKLFNPTAIIHKLSHQHLHTKFWIVNTKAVKMETIKWSTISQFPVPVLIANFLNDHPSL